MKVKEAMWRDEGDEQPEIDRGFDAESEPVRTPSTFRRSLGEWLGILEGTRDEQRRFFKGAFDELPPF
jgi:hypothetical protein